MPIIDRLRARGRQQMRWALPVWFLTRVTAVLPDSMPACRLRGRLLRPFIHSCGPGLLVGRDVTMLNTERLQVGRDVYFAKGAWINAAGGMDVEDEVVIGPYVTISTLKHGFKDGSAHRGGSHAESVNIGRGTWLAAHVSVASGSRIGSGCLIAANSAVSGAISPNTIAGGVPARVIKANDVDAGPYTSAMDIAADE